MAWPMNTCSLVRELRGRLVRERPLLWLLLGVNVAGAAYGFDWYAGQLKVTPVWLWPLTADSPMSLFFFSLALVSWLGGRRWRAMETLGHLGLLKYGFWTMFVIGEYWATGGRFQWIDSFLFVSHGLMALEALLLVGELPLPGAAFTPACLWYVVNDYFDYLHPGTPTMGALDAAALTRVVSLASTPAFALLLLALRSRADRPR